MENSENDQSFVNCDVLTNKEKPINTENRVSFQSSLIIPPRSFLTKSIKKPIKQMNNSPELNSRPIFNSARISKPISYDLPLIPIAGHVEELNNKSCIKNKKSNYAKSRRPLSARSYNNVTLDTLLNSVEKEMISSKKLQKTTNNCIYGRNVSSRRSASINHLSSFNSKIKVQKPLSPRTYRNETEKSTLSFNYRMNRKYPK